MPVYELRTYQIASGGMPTVESIFRELVAPMLPDYAMKGIGFWASADDTTLYYIVEHDSETVIRENWDRFHADPRWQLGLAEREHGKSAVTHTESVPLRGIEGLSPIGVASREM